MKNMKNNFRPFFLTAQNVEKLSFFKSLCLKGLEKQRRISNIMLTFLGTPWHRQAEKISLQYFQSFSDWFYDFLNHQLVLQSLPAVLGVDIVFSLSMSAPVFLCKNRIAQRRSDGE
jgi:hypothetical protein